MISKKKLLLNTDLYLIVNIQSTRNHNLLLDKTGHALKSGVKILQLRWENIGERLLLKLAQNYRSICLKYDALFIVNNRIDIALSSNADGVHLGQSDLPVFTARNILGANKIIGKSTHSIKQALKAQAEKADYIGFGPIFNTKTKPRLRPIGANLIKQLKNKIRIPFFAIGGINTRNIDKVVAAGASKIAVSNAVLSSKNPGIITKILKGALNK